MNYSIDYSDPSYLQAFLDQFKQSDNSDQTPDVSHVSSKNPSVSDVDDSSGPVTKQQIQNLINKLKRESEGMEDFLEDYRNTDQDILNYTQQIINDQKALQQMITQYKSQGMQHVGTDSVADQFQKQFNTPTIEQTSASTESSWGNYDDEVQQIASGNDYNASYIGMIVDEWTATAANSLGLSY